MSEQLGDEEIGGGGAEMPDDNDGDDTDGTDGDADGTDGTDGDADAEDAS